MDQAGGEDVVIFEHGVEFAYKRGLGLHRRVDERLTGRKVEAEWWRWDPGRRRDIGGDILPEGSSRGTRGRR